MYLLIINNKTLEKGIKNLTIKTPIVNFEQINVNRKAIS